MSKILITGGTGLLGTNWALQTREKNEVHILSNQQKIKIEGTYTHDLDWENKSNYEKLVSSLSPDLIINAAGFTNVDDCETQFEKSMKANVMLAERVAKSAFNNQAKLVHISTDHLFSGKSSFNTEQDETLPLNTYAKHKLEAETRVSLACSEAIICRTNFFGWSPSYRPAFLDKILEELKSGNVVQMFDDVFFTPISIPCLVDIVNILIKQNEYGLINVCGNERLSKYHFAVKIASAFGFDPNQIQPIQASRIKGGTIRPPDLSLSDKRLRGILKSDGISIQTSISSLKSDISYREEIQSLGKVFPYGRHHLDKEDVAAVTRTLLSGVLTQGKKIDEFEQHVCDYTGAKFAVAVSSATAGLHLSYLALGMGSGKTVLTSPITFVSTANAAHYCNGSARFADIDNQTINMNFDQVKKQLDCHRDIHIVAPVLLGGASDGVPEISKLARKYKKFIVEDAAHGLGGSYACGSRIGSCKYSDCTVFSMHPVKSIAAGEGGIITTNDFEIYKALLRLRSHGINKLEDKIINADNAYSDNDLNIWYYEMAALGYHYRLTDIQATLANSQLSKLERFMKKRRELVHNYLNAFPAIENIEVMQNVNFNRSANHLFIASIDFDKLGISRNSVMRQLRNRNIITQVHYIPVPMQPFYSSEKNNLEEIIPNSINYYKKALSIPLYFDFTEREQQYFLNCLDEVLNQKEHQ
ncbi:DegT/DnrJ/EryC1/StrS family aminotransferase [Alphaproteobacteria bacterium]|nr:DegT/DnrJ/EryC1/StrS family aminotransferase [Alphaproteobacteria bacterium]